MRKLKFHLINVFAESVLQGNPLCVFEDGRGLTDAEMQALALQFNLSETTFLLPSESATRHMRIFTPLFEMPFAGHPTLGSAHVTRMIAACGDALTLQTKAGVVPVNATHDQWELQIPAAQKTRAFDGSRALVAEMLGVAEEDVIGESRYVSTGNEQFIVPLASRDAVMRMHPNAALLKQHVKAQITERYMAYGFAWESPTQIVSRFFFPTASGMAEDPGTGSACANLGGYLLATGKAAPFAITVDQGEKTGRRCKLTLRVNAAQQIHVGGRCVRIGGGEIALD